jgi:hypothetical protein
VLGQARKQALAQPAAHGAHALVGVEDDERALLVGDAVQRALELARRRRELAALDDAGLPAALLGASRHLAQQRALADAAWPVHQDDVGGRVRDEQVVEERELPLASDEPLRVAGGESIGQRGHDRDTG